MSDDLVADPQFVVHHRATGRHLMARARITAQLPMQVARGNFDAFLSRTGGGAKSGKQGFAKLSGRRHDEMSQALARRATPVTSRAAGLAAAFLLATK
ncbi:MULTISPECIES: hypothetical protein [unclassified Sphingomonas]|uniref:hypothetical protein n=1 Tax=unclassified Sphingomonas TaxID=196159 RepID=UPI0012E1FD4E|nr:MULTISPECIES: hypothetical protein [unclassified Sphingomonas]